MSSQVFSNCRHCYKNKCSLSNCS